MKYLLTTLEYPPQVGGVATYYENLLSAWPQGDEWTVIDNSKNELVGTGRFGWLRAISVMFRSRHYDLTFVGQILPLGTAALIVSLFTRLNYAVVLHGMDLTFALRSKRKRFITKLILRRAKHIICANSYVQKLLEEVLPTASSKIIIVNPGVVAGSSDDEIKKDLLARYNPEGKKIIFSIGRLVKRKGFDQVISALSGLKDNNWVYLIAGDGPEKQELISQAAESPVTANIKFIDKISEAEKWSCLDICDIFIMTSRDIKGDFEGFGIVYLEANIAGKPVIAGNSGGVADAVIDGETGLLVNPENIEEIAGAITKLLANPNETNRLGEIGRKRALDDFNWKGQAEKLKIYLSKK